MILRYYFNIKRFQTSINEIETIGREFDSFYIPMRELVWRQLRPVNKRGHLTPPPLSK